MVSGLVEWIPRQSHMIHEVHFLPWLIRFTFRSVPLAGSLSFPFVTSEMATGRDFVLWAPPGVRSSSSCSNQTTPHHDRWWWPTLAFPADTTPAYTIRLRNRETANPITTENIETYCTSNKVIAMPLLRMGNAWTPGLYLLVQGLVEWAMKGINFLISIVIIMKWP